MAERRRERLVDGLIDSNKYGVVLKVVASSLRFYGSSYCLSLFYFRVYSFHFNYCCFIAALDVKYSMYITYHIDNRVTPTA